MWLCPKCGESIEGEFDACWKCGRQRDGGPSDVEIAAAEVAAAAANPLKCTRCDLKLEYVGTKKFHEGSNWGVLGELGELFVNKEKLDLYSCPRCGRVEFFVDGVGEEFRPH